MTENPSNVPGPLVEALRAAQRVTALTGAGISAESGVPAFRDAQTGLGARRPTLIGAPPLASRQFAIWW